VDIRNIEGLAGLSIASLWTGDPAYSSITECCDLAMLYGVGVATTSRSSTDVPRSSSSRWDDMRRGMPGVRDSPLPDIAN
jgi:hypothetical protein